MDTRFAEGRITLVTEACNMAEGQSTDAFVRAVLSVEKIRRRYSEVDVIVLYPTVERIAEPILAERFPGMHCLHVPGKTYDGQKNPAAIAGQGEFSVYLDGDCVPCSDDWLQRLLSPLLELGVHAVGGLTLYEGNDLTSKAMSILDFGFLFVPAADGTLGCDASDNIAFRRASYLEVMAPDVGLLRCYCSKQAQLLARAATPVHARHSAFIGHELPDVRKERTRRGYDYVAALWADPVLESAGKLSCNQAVAQELLQSHLCLSLTRLKAAPPELGVRPCDRPELAAEMQRLMTLDLQGVFEALEAGAANGLDSRTRAAPAEHVARSRGAHRRAGSAVGDGIDNSDGW
jgi:hypothetical protein